MAYDERREIEEYVDGIPEIIVLPEGTTGDVLAVVSPIIYAASQIRAVMARYSTRDI